MEATHDRHRGAHRDRSPRGSCRRTSTTTTRCTAWRSSASSPGPGCSWPTSPRSPRPGDFVVRNVVDDSFLVTRDRVGAIHVMFNMCVHRGHAGVPGRAGHRVDLPLPVPRVDVPQRRHAGRRPVPRRGLRRRRRLRQGGPGAAGRAVAGDPQRADLRQASIPDAPPFEEWLGDFAFYLDFYTAQSPAGMELRGPAALADRGQLEDRRRELRRRQLPHAPHPRERRRDRAVRRAAAEQAQGGRALPRRAGRRHDVQAAAGRRLRGRAAATSATTRTSSPPPGRLAGRRPAGARSASSGFMPSAATMFPNLSFVHNWPEVRRRPGRAVHLDPPVAAGRTRRDRGAVVVRGRGGRAREFKADSYRAYLMCFGSSGMFEQDDVENWVSITTTARGAMARRLLLNSRMGLRHDGTPDRRAVRRTSPGRARPARASASTTSATCFDCGPTALRRPPPELAPALRSAGRGDER